jgi:hypothetical protein
LADDGSLTTCFHASSARDLLITNEGESLVGLPKAHASKNKGNAVAESPS